MNINFPDINHYLQVGRQTIVDESIKFKNQTEPFIHQMTAEGYKWVNYTSSIIHQLAQDGTHFALQTSKRLSQAIAEQGGKLKGRTMPLVNKTMTHIRRDPLIAGVLIAGANIGILKLAFKAAEATDRQFASRWGAQKNWSSTGKFVHSMTLLSIFSAVMIGMNVGFYQVFKPSLSPLKATAASAITCASYAVCKLFFAANIGESGDKS